MKEEKRHVGRPTNEEVRQRRNKKIIRILIPVIAIMLVVGGIIFEITDNPSNIKKLGATAYPPQDYTFDSNYFINKIDVDCWITDINGCVKCYFKATAGKKIKKIGYYLYTDAKTTQNQKVCGGAKSNKGETCLPNTNEYYKDKLPKENGQYVVYAFVTTYDSSVSINESTANNYGYARSYKIVFPGEAKKRTNTKISLISNWYCNNCTNSKNFPAPKLNASAQDNSHPGLKCTYGKQAATNGGKLVVPYGKEVKCTTQKMSSIYTSDGATLTAGYAKTQSDAYQAKFNYESAPNDVANIAATNLSGKNAEVIHIVLKKKKAKKPGLSCTYGNKTVKDGGSLKVPYGGVIKCKTKYASKIYTRSKNTDLASNYDLSKSNTKEKQFKFLSGTKTPVNVAARIGKKIERIKIKLYDSNAGSNNNNTTNNTTTNKQPTTSTKKEKISPDLKCTYKSPNTGKIKVRKNGKTLAIIENDKFTCTAAKKAIITPASGCSLVSGSKYTCSKDSKIVAKLGDVKEKVIIHTVKKKKAATTTTTKKPNNTSTTTTKLVGNNKCRVLQITPGSNSVNITPVCGKNAKLIRVNIYKESKAVISRKNVKSADTVLFNKLSKGKYYVGLVYKAKKVKHSTSLKSFEITDGETYSVYKYNLNTNTELCGVENSKIINGKVTYSVKCGSNAKLSGTVLYDETNHKPIVMERKMNNNVGFNKELTYQNSEIKTTNNYHIRLYWTTNNDNSGTGVSVFARSTSTIKYE